MFNLLVVDDEKNVRLYMEAVLKKNNYNVFTPVTAKRLSIYSTANISTSFCSIS